jgi:hypothetical protein
MGAELRFLRFCGFFTTHTQRKVFVFEFCATFALEVSRLDCIVFFDVKNVFLSENLARVTLSLKQHRLNVGKNVPSPSAFQNDDISQTFFKTITTKKKIKFGQEFFWFFS